MSHLVATLHAYDTFHRVRYVVRVNDLDLPSGSSRCVLALDVQYLGVGISDPVTWTRDLCRSILAQLELYGG
jgi:hypothetical protein